MEKTMNNLNQLGTERKLRSEKGKYPFKNPRWVYEGEKLMKKAKIKAMMSALQPLWG